MSRLLLRGRCGRVSLGCQNEELGIGDLSEAGQGLKMVGGEGVSVKSEVDGGNSVVPDLAVPVGSDGSCVKTELASKEVRWLMIRWSSVLLSWRVPLNSDDDSDKESEDDDRVNGDLVKEGRAKADGGVDEMEEGEIREADEQAMHAENKTRESESDDDVVDEMVDWGIVDIQTEGFEGLSEDENEVVAGPIMSKNELKVLPPVPSVSVKLEPHHEMGPIGPVLSVFSPFSSNFRLLWIAESRSPLGFIDEIFGPMKNPYYLVRYNSKAEIPTGIKEGTLVSSVPEYASYVVNQKDLYKKGYDLSGKNDRRYLRMKSFQMMRREPNTRGCKGWPSETRK
ncbi:hypothetical protein MLD38_003459 [Melastoma candidum]|uniref:Uncharacterized protein n=1 Tax=Melastoma candidum TaxID=119954 RepID=A0ACB9SB68_9MYRT|nr:hypothetical protein MLD38_003459 [Melastoma candidum]